MSCVLLEIKKGVATVRLNRPNTLNSYDEALSKDLLSVTEELMQDKTLRLVVLKGEGAVFMAGGDIDFFKDNFDNMPTLAPKLIRTLATTVKNFQAMNMPVLAVAHGAVAGAGLSLLLACDLVIAEENTVFTTAYSRLGLSPDGGMSYFLPRAVGQKKAMELMMLSERFTAEDAMQWGLINESVSQDALDERQRLWEEKIITLPRRALVNIKKLNYRSENQSLSQQLENEAASFVELTQTENFREGVNAFIEKRPAKFN